MPIKRYGATHDPAVSETHVGQAPDMPTEVVPPPADVVGVEATAWAEVDDFDDLSNPDDRRPLPVSLIALLSGVVFCGIGLGAYVIGEHMNQVRPAPYSAAPTAAPPTATPTNPPTTAVAVAAPKPTTTVVTPAMKFPPNAWDAFTYLLRTRGLWIDADQKDFDDKENRRLCLILDSNGDPAFHQRVIQKAIAASEGGTWGQPEATYAIHSAVMAYCPQYDQPGWFTP